MTLITKESLTQRALTIVAEAERANLKIRLMGGAAVALLAPRGVEKYPRGYKDLDFFTLSRYRKGLEEVFKRLGIQPEERFNALHGHVRMIFHDTVLGTDIDVMVDEFRMCHRLDLKDRLDRFSPTLPPSDIFLTKIQIVQMTENDLKDLMALLSDMELGEEDTRETLDVNRITSVMSSDWGFYRTFTLNIERLISSGDSLVSDRASRLKSLVDKSPKSSKWKMRAKIGDRVKWYEEPEEVR